jgi:putative pyruvate formate lyase activating enzyme
MARRDFTREKKIELIRSYLDEAYSLMESCSLCPRACHVNRLEDEKGFCGLGRELMVSSHQIHYGEEPPISGTRGSGTIFFTSCTMSCVFCQNYPISQLRYGNAVSTQKLAEMMFWLAGKGVHNINFVTPSHQTPMVLESLLEALQKGLDIPIVFNSGGYEALKVLKLWEGIIDIYLPDMKYADRESAEKYSQAPDYPDINRKAVKEMQKQVGTLLMDEEGIGIMGLLIRHLILPNKIAGTEEILRFIAEELSRETYISLMSQYFPAHKALKIDELKRKLRKQEYKEALSLLERFGLENGWLQTKGFLGRKIKWV